MVDEGSIRRCAVFVEICPRDAQNVASDAAFVHFADRVARLEEQVASLQKETADLKQQLADFRKQFE
jgi:hypothetical protein